jgi:hypothetical protein
MGWFDDFHDEVTRENEGLKVHQTRVFLEALSVILLSIRGLAECLEYFPMTVVQPIQRWGMEWTEAVAPHLRWIPGIQGVTDEIFARWFFGILYQVPVLIGFTLFFYVILRILGKKPSFLLLLMVVGIAAIPYKTWWYSASGEATWVITPQRIFLGFPGEMRIVPPIQEIEAYWRTYIFTGLFFFMWSVGLMYGLLTRQFGLSRWQGYLINFPWIVYLTYCLSGIWKPNNPDYNFWSVSFEMAMIAVCLYFAAIGGRWLFIKMGLQGHVARQGNKWACTLAFIGCLIYYGYGTGLADKKTIETELLAMGGHFKSTDKTVSELVRLDREGLIKIDKQLTALRGGEVQVKITYDDTIRSLVKVEDGKLNIRSTPRNETMAALDEAIVPLSELYKGSPFEPGAVPEDKAALLKKSMSALGTLKVEMFGELSEKTAEKLAKNVNLLSSFIGVKELDKKRAKALNKTIKALVMLQQDGAWSNSIAVLQDLASKGKINLDKYDPQVRDAILIPQSVRHSADTPQLKEGGAV